MTGVALRTATKTRADHFSLRALDQLARRFEAARVNVLVVGRALGVLLFRANRLLDQAKTSDGFEAGHKSVLW
jgi:hypothetical protein